MKAPLSLARRSAAPLGIALAGLALALTGCTQTTQGTPLAAEPGPLTPPEISVFELDGLLLSADELDSAAGLSSMRVLKAELTKMWDDSDSIDNAACLGTWSPLQIASYRGSDWNVSRGSMFNDSPAPDAPADHSVVQAVVRFDNIDAAQDYANESATAWEQCDGQTVTSTSSDGRKKPWMLEDFARDGDTLTMRQSPLGMSRGGCLRALKPRSNVIIDVMVCGADVTDEASKITSAIADGMPQV